MLLWVKYVILKKILSFENCILMINCCSYLALMNGSNLAGTEPLLRKMKRNLKLSSYR